MTYTLNLHLSAHGEWLYYFSHFWTLCVEEQFYLGWPLLIFAIPRRAMLPTIFAITAIPMLMRVWWL